MSFASQALLFGLVAVAGAGPLEPRGTSTVPDYFQTSFGPYAGKFYLLEALLNMS